LCRGGEEAEIPSRKGDGMRGKSQGVQALRGGADHTTYKSPQRKLVTFFHKSRNQWKGKCRAAKAELKTLKKKLRGMGARQQRWKSRVKVLEGELTRLRAEQRALAKAGERGGKKEHREGRKV